jgi:hypothetical protein
VTTTEPEEPTATVVSYPQGWHLVERGSWQVSVAPDGLIMLPRHLTAADVADFCAAVQAAAPIATRQSAENDEKTTPPPTEEELLASAGVFVTEAGADPPSGAVRMMTTPRAGAQVDQAAIGRPRRKDPRQPPSTQPPLPPNSGGRRGRTKR